MRIHNKRLVQLCDAWNDLTRSNMIYREIVGPLIEHIMQKGVRILEYMGVFGRACRGRKKEIMTKPQGQFTVQEQT